MNNIRRYCHEIINRLRITTHRSHERGRSVLVVLLAGIVLLVATRVAPAQAPITAHIESGTPVPIAIFKPGDRVRLQYVLHTTDNVTPEIIQNEPLFISLSSPGGFSVVVSGYETLLTSVIDTVPPDPNGPPVLSAYIQGFDGDESADISVFVNPFEPLKKSAAQVSAWEKKADKLEYQGIRDHIAAEFCPPIPPWCKIALTSEAILKEVASLYYRRLAADPADPADPNYTVVALPVTPTLPPLPTDPNTPAALFDALNAARDNERQALGLLRAALTSLDRALGAMEAGDTYWQQRQTNAAAAYLAETGVLEDNQPTLELRLKNLLVANGFPPIAVTPTAIHDFQLQTNAGLPVDTVQILQQMGLSANDIEEIRRMIPVQDFNLVAQGGGFPDNLTYAPLATAYHGAADRLFDLLAGNGSALGPDEQVHGAGFILKPDGSRVTFEFDAETEQEDGATRLEGNVSLRDKTAGVVIHHGRVERTTRLGRVVVLDGSFQDKNGSPGTFRLIGIDNGTPGKGQDAFAIILSNGYRAGGIVGGGNVRVDSDRQIDD